MCSGINEIKPLEQQKQMQQQNRIDFKENGNEKLQAHLGLRDAPWTFL
jgi:hypothetical protein